MVRYVALLLAVGVLNAAGSEVPSVRTQSATWAITAQAADRYSGQPADQVSYWLGVKNVSSLPQPACMLSAGYGLVSPEHGVGGTIDGLPFHPSPHACRTPVGVNLVLPGESLLFYVPITLPKWASSDYHLTFSVSLVEPSTGEWVTLGTLAKLAVSKPNGDKPSK